jgi:YidC/Oxa1 family membrane protein insertase
MWEFLFIKPVVNLLVLIQDYMPGNDLGLAILVFTIIVRTLMWPLIKKQIHQTRLMQKINPEINKIRAKAKGSKDRQVLENVNKETMALYKKHGISPFSSIGTMFIQLPLFIAIYSAVKTTFANDSARLAELLYGPVKELPFIKGILSEGAKNITTFADWADLARRPFLNNEVYIPVVIIALVSIFVQYLQVKQTMPAKKTKTEDPGEKMNKAMPYLMVIIFGWISLSVEGAISFYLGAGALVAIFQQYYLIKKEDQVIATEESSRPKVSVLSSTKKEEKSDLNPSQTKKPTPAKTTKPKNNKGKKKSKKR